MNEAPKNTSGNDASLMDIMAFASGTADDETQARARAALGNPEHPASFLLHRGIDSKVRAETAEFGERLNHELDAAEQQSDDV